MLVIHPESHVDHVPASVIEFVKNFFATSTNPAKINVTATLSLPDEVDAVDCSLYGPAMGDPPVSEDEVQYQVRPGRSWPSRMVARPIRQTRTLTLVAGPHDGHDLVLYTYYGGPAAPREVNDPDLEVADSEASIEFWRHHALALGT
jgi:hypothetical protein